MYSLVDKLKWFYKNARCYNKIYIFTAIIINGSDGGDCGGRRGRVGVGGTDDRHFYLKEPVNKNDTPFYYIQVYFMRAMLCWKTRNFPD